MKRATQDCVIRLGSKPRWHSRSRPRPTAGNVRLPSGRRRGPSPPGAFWPRSWATRSRLATPARTNAVKLSTSRQLLEHAVHTPARTNAVKLSTSRQLLEHAVHMRIIDASCTENGSDGGDG